MFAEPSDAQLDNRYTQHTPKGSQAGRADIVRAKILETAKCIRDNTPASAEQDQAFKALDIAMFNASAAIYRNE